MQHIGPNEIAGTPVWAVILMVMFLAFGAGLVIRLALPRLKSGATGWFVLFGLVLVGLMFFGLLRIRMEYRVQPPVEVIASTPHFVHLEPSVALPPIAATPRAPAVPGESIEELWKKLTAPRINLEETTTAPSNAPTMGPSSPQELTAAARVILSASLPGADPFTQGWLVNAAKSILGVPVSSEEQAELHAAAAEAVASMQAPASSPPAAVAVAEIASALASDSVNASPISISKRVELPKPDWVLAPPKQIGNVRRIVLESDPFATEEECRRELDEKMQKLVLDRAIELSQASFSGNRFGDPNLHNLGLGEDYIRRELCTDEFVDTVDSSVGEMKKSYVLLEFNEAQDALLVDRARTHARREGLVDTTLLAAFAFGSVAALFGLFKIDTWTRGYYTKRLFLGVPAAIIMVLTLFAVASK
jgi:hypothetical protein